MSSGTVVAKNGSIFRIERDMIDVTSMSRPNTSWKFIDAHGHEHRWYVEHGVPQGMHVSAGLYKPSVIYILPTLVRIEDVPATDDYPAVSHYECAQCGERVSPGSCADVDVQYVPGIARCYVNGRPVTLDEFTRLAREAGFDVP